MVPNERQWQLDIKHFLIGRVVYGVGHEASLVETAAKTEG